VHVRERSGSTDDVEEARSGGSEPPRAATTEAGTAGDGTSESSTAEDPTLSTEPLAPRPAVDPRSPSLDRWLPILAIAGMIGTYLALPAAVAMTFVAGIWLGWTRLLGRPTLLGLTLTQALAWLATSAIAEFLAVLILFALSGGAAGGA
jgi:hypothetical protein